MRFIPTSAITVEKLKQQAKKSKTKLQLSHSEALDRIARGSGYNHWGHVTWCQKETERQANGPSLLKECDYIVEAALSGNGKLVITGPEILAKQPLILFSTENGDAWVLEPNEGLAICLAWQGERNEPRINDKGRQLKIEWDGEFAIEDDSFAVDIGLPPIGKRAIFGYPVDKLRDAIFKVESFAKRMSEVFTNRDTVEISDELLEQLVHQGWKREDLEHARSAGAEYSPKRNSLLFPIESN